jgi:capsular polysaccharide biosynthesis protein
VCVIKVFHITIKNYAAKIKWTGENNRNVIKMTIRGQAERQRKAMAAAVSAKTEKALSDIGYNDGVVNLEPGTKIPDWGASALKSADVGSAADFLNIKTY